MYIFIHIEGIVFAYCPIRQGKEYIALYINWHTIRLDQANCCHQAVRVWDEEVKGGELQLLSIYFKLRSNENNTFEALSHECIIGVWNVLFPLANYLLFQVNDIEKKEACGEISPLSESDPTVKKYLTSFTTMQDLVLLFRLLIKSDRVICLLLINKKVK